MTNQETGSEANALWITHEEPLLVPGAVSMTRATAHAVVIKEGDLFFLCEPDGRLPLEAGHGFGLYYHDCRFLSGYELRLSGRKPETLVHTAERGFLAVLGLSNADIR